MTEIDESSEKPVAPTPGQLLLEARERAQLTQQQVAQALHMSVSKVKAIECDDYSKLNVDTYIRGYLRSYAALLKLEPAILIAAYEEQAVAQGLLPRLDEACLPKENSGKKAWSFMLSLGALFALLLLITVWFMGNQVSTAPATLSTPVQAVDKTDSVPSIDDELGDKTVEHGDQQSAIANVDGKDKSDVKADASTENAGGGDEPQVVSQMQTPAELDRLQLSFTAECWLEVSDAQGDVLATELQRPGSQLSLLGRAPFQVTLGYPSAAAIKLNGVSVTIPSPSGASNVVNLTVGAN